MEMVDMLDLESNTSNSVRVQVSLSSRLLNILFIFIFIKTGGLTKRLVHRKKIKIIAFNVYFF